MADGPSHRRRPNALDAETIALFAERLRPEARAVPDKQARLLAELVARRRQIVTMIGMESNRRRQARARRLQKRLDAHLAWLQKELSAIEGNLDQAVRSSPAWRADHDLLTSVPGVGSTTARVLIAEIPELGRLDRRKIAALVGLAPINKDSGSLRRRRMIQGGPADVRHCLYMATLTATRPNHAIKDLYHAGRPAKLALTACMRKLLTILNAVLRDQRPWQNA